MANSVETKLDLIIKKLESMDKKLSGIKDNASYSASRLNPDDRW